MTKSVLNDQQVPLSTLPPSQTQKRFALAIVLVLFARSVPQCRLPRCRSHTSESSFLQTPLQCL
jgi:hypothetical protein